MMLNQFKTLYLLINICQINVVHYSYRPNKLHGGATNNTEQVCDQWKCMAQTHVRAKRLRWSKRHSFSQRNPCVCKYSWRTPVDFTRARPFVWSSHKWHRESTGGVAQVLPPSGVVCWESASHRGRARSTSAWYEFDQLMKTHSTTTFGVCYNELCDYISSGNLCKLYVQRHKFLKIGYVGLILAEI